MAYTPFDDRFAARNPADNSPAGPNDLPPVTSLLSEASAVSPDWRQVIAADKARAAARVGPTEQRDVGQALDRFRDAFFQAWRGYSGLQGQDALDSYADFSQSLDDARDKVLTGVSGPTRAMVMPLLDDMHRHGQAAGLIHYGQQRQSVDGEKAERQRAEPQFAQNVFNRRGDSVTAFDVASQSATGSDRQDPQVAQGPVSNTKLPSPASSRSWQLIDRDKNYLDKYYQHVAKWAKEYNVDPAFVLALGAESAYATGGTYLKTGDAIGMTGGHNDQNMTTARNPEENVEKLFKYWGEQIRDTGSNWNAFVNGLLGKDANGRAVPGWKSYNSQYTVPWLQMLNKNVGQMRKDLPVYLNQPGR